MLRQSCIYGIGMQDHHYHHHHHHHNRSVLIISIIIIVNQQLDRIRNPITFGPTTFILLLTSTIKSTFILTSLILYLILI